MRKTFIGAVCATALLLAGCEKLELPSENEDGGASEIVTKTKEVTFKVKGGFDQAMTRATAVGESGMADLWVLDYQDGALVQTVHQASTDEGFGSPTLSLTMGSHSLYFACSAGGSPMLNTDAHKIVWGVPRDTFWKKLTKNVTNSTGSTATVTLERVATRLKVNIEDAIPEGTAAISLTPTKWYYGLDYLTGVGTDTKSEAFTISIPSSYAGRTNTKVGILGMAQESEFTTNVTLTAKDGSENVLATETITGAPMQKNRSTDYTGTLFLSENVLGVSVEDEWGSPYQGTW